MSWAIRCVGRANGLPCQEAGLLVKTYDPDFADGVGHVTWTNEPDKALQFDSQVLAFEAWRRQSTTKPLVRGRPNRPLTVFTIMVEEA